MCGIGGIINKQNSRLKIEPYLKHFQKKLHHRGPNDSGSFLKDNYYGFVNLRLSIVDIAAGHQPIFNKRGNIGIVYNGEIYNYLELRRKLEKKKYKFKTKSDTEVILLGFEAYGPAIFEKLNGMFAVCVWNSETDEIYLARDQFGIKPLYLYEDEKILLFSSELKALLGLPALDKTLNPLAIQDYLTFRYVQAPYTFFNRIRKLEQGSYLHFRNHRKLIHKYWDIAEKYKISYPVPNIQEVKHELLSKLEKAVSSQLMGEVPVGVLLSGGVDSSSIAYMIHKLGANLLTFNIGFHEVNEFEYSRTIAKQLGLKHLEVLMTVNDLVSEFDRVNFAIDEPIADAATLPLYHLCRELKKHVTVVLSGEGGDEVFAGYPQYRSQLAKINPPDLRFVAFLKESYYFDNALEYLLNKTLPADTKRFQQYFEEQPLLDGMLAYDLKTWMPENLMMKADKILMAHSLEGRFPYLDIDLFDYVATLPIEYKISPSGESKWILKQILQDKLPEKIIYRPKMGFTVPIDLLLQKMRDKVLDTINSCQKTELSNYLNLKLIKRNFENYYFRPSERTLWIWTIFVMLYWYQFSFKKYEQT